MSATSNNNNAKRSSSELPANLARAAVRVVEAFLTAADLIESIKTRERDRSTRNPLRKIGKPKVAGAARELVVALSRAANAVRGARHEVRGQRFYAGDLAAERMSAIFTRLHNQVIQPLLNALHESQQPGGCPEDFYQRLEGALPAIVADAKRALAESVDRPRDSGFDSGSVKEVGGAESRVVSVVQP